MNIILRNTIRCAVGALILATSLAGPALTAQASSPKAFVDNTGHCKNAYNTIQDAITALGPNPTGTITVCAGTYVAGGTISGANKLKLIAKKKVLIAPPPGFTGNIFTVQNSTNVTIQGFAISGGSALAASGTNIAISYDVSSGTISRNTITGWRQADLSTISSLVNAISVTNASVTPTPVKILSNKVTDYQGYGLYLSGTQALLTVINNKISGTSVSGAQPFGIAAFAIGPSKMVHNTITSDYVPGVSSTQGMAIYTVNSSSLRITGNKVAHWTNGIGVFAACFTPSTPVGTASNNTVSGNKISEVGAGITLESDANSTGACTSNVYNAKVTGNKVTNLHLPGYVGILVVTQQSGAGTSLAQNELVKGNTIKHFNYSANSGVQLLVIGGGQGPLGVFRPNHFIP